MKELHMAITNIRSTLNIQQRNGNPNAAFLASRLPQPKHSGRFDEMIEEALNGQH